MHTTEGVRGIRLTSESTVHASHYRCASRKRVSLTPEIVGKFAQAGAQILVEKGLGALARFPDAAYKNVAWADSPAAVLDGAQVVLTVQPLSVEQITRLKSGTVVIGYMQAY